MKDSGSRSRIESSLLARLYEQSDAARWSLTIARFQESLDASLGHAVTAGEAAPQDIERYLSGLHLQDLALAAACAAGSEPAWDHFLREHRPALYRAADAIDPTGGARELADSLYADLFGLREQRGVRQSLFRYFHGRSTLTTWLRAVLSQRHIDALRAGRRLDPLPDEERDTVDRSSTIEPRPDRPRWIDAMRGALVEALAALDPRDRLRLNCYYVQDLTLAAIGRLLREHEATVSRHLTRTRRAIRESIERCLREQHGLNDEAITECFESVAEDSGTMDLGEILAVRKLSAQDRSSK